MQAPPPPSHFLASSLVLGNSLCEVCLSTSVGQARDQYLDGGVRFEVLAFGPKTPVIGSNGSGLQL